MALRELREWKNRLGVSHRKFEDVERKIKTFRDYYRGIQWSSDDTRYTDQIVDNMVYANVRAILPRLNFRNPKIFVKAKKKPYRTKKGMFDTLAGSLVLEIALNYYYKELKTKTETRKCLVDALLGYWGIMELGYTLETEKVQSDELIEINELIKSDSPFAVRRSPMDFRHDPEGVDSHLNDSRWIALKWVKTLEDVKANPKYSGTRGLKSNYTVKTDYGSGGTSDSHEEFTDSPDLWKRVEGWDIWDRKTHRLMTIVDEHDKFLQNEKSWPLELDGFPVEILYFNENPDEIMPISDVEIYLPMQDELNRIASLMLSHIRKISERRYEVRENSMEPEEKTKLTHGGDGTIVETKVKEAIIPIQDANISQDIYINRQLIKRTIREMAGLSDMEALSTSKFDQATEPALIERAVQTLREDQREIFEDFIKRIVSKIADILQQTADSTSIPLDNEQRDLVMSNVPSKIEKIAGPEGAQIILPWLNMSKDDIQGDYDFDIEVGSTQPINEETRKRDAVALYNMLAQNPYIRGREGTKDVLEAFNKQDPDKYLKTEEEVMEMAQMQRKQAIEGQVAVDKPKRDTDLQKTVIKSRVQREGNILKAQGEKAKTAASILSAMLKDSKPKENSD